MKRLNWAASLQHFSLSFSLKLAGAHLRDPVIEQAEQAESSNSLAGFPVNFLANER